MTKLFLDFFKSEKAGGFVLVLCAALSLFSANTYSPYNAFWLHEVGGGTIVHWINDGLMAVFFLLVGLELKREILAGELATMRRALLPVVAALGGMIVPAAIYLSLNEGKALLGFGIPMATDIAFAIGALSVLGKRVPLALKIFVTALAVIDDLGAIFVIAVFYSTNISVLYIAAALVILLILFLFNRFKINSLLLYSVGGGLLWFCMLRSGVHATLAGVALAAVIPFDKGAVNAPSYRLQMALHYPVAFLILPLFALANTSIIIPPGVSTGFFTPINLGIMIGLVIGKPVGIFFFSGIAVKIKLCVLPSSVNWPAIFGAGILGGIGFTMSIFISLLAFTDNQIIDQAKIAVMVASLIATVAGIFYLKIVLQKSID